MTKKELRKISLQYRTLSSQMLKIDSQEEINCVKIFFDYITNTSFIMEYISECHKENYDFAEIYKNKSWNDMLTLPDSQEAIIDYGYQLLQYILDGPKQLHALAYGYSSSKKFKDMIAAFMRKTVEPFVTAVKSYLELSLLDCPENESEVTTELQEKTLFLSYCQKDSDIANMIEGGLAPHINGKARISRDIRDVEYHESFKKFMQTIETHDFVIMIISDHYLKSRNCMFEVLEVIKDSQFQKKLAFIVLSDGDIQYYQDQSLPSIGAKVYSLEGQTTYSLYWAKVEKELQEQIEALGDPTRAIHQIKEKRIVQKILLDLPEFMEFIKDAKGLPLTEHIKTEFKDILNFMGL
ncbi:MAG: toll/interleukin-1 receptor domain-containing protein [Oscillospiraceae bacterium]|nr:toll/interleukin-1 receptor domain-containing protein [Oscillospiraceae bacterium]